MEERKFEPKFAHARMVYRHGKEQVINNIPCETKIIEEDDLPQALEEGWKTNLEDLRNPEPETGLDGPEPMTRKDMIAAAKIYGIKATGLSDEELENALIEARSKEKAEENAETGTN